MTDSTFTQIKHERDRNHASALYHKRKRVAAETREAALLDRLAALEAERAGGVTYEMLVECEERVLAAEMEAVRIKRVVCCSTHCERSQECRTPHECCGNDVGKADAYRKLEVERAAGEARVGWQPIETFAEMTSLSRGNGVLIADAAGEVGEAYFRNFGDDDDGWWWINTSWGDYPNPDRPAMPLRGEQPLPEAPPAALAKQEPGS